MTRLAAVEVFEHYGDKDKKRFPTTLLFNLRDVAFYFFTASLKNRKRRRERRNRKGKLPVYLLILMRRRKRKKMMRVMKIRMRRKIWIVSI